jgi:hypothetical protein
LSRGRYAINEKLAWEGEIESEDDVSFTPLENHVRENFNRNVMLDNKVYLEVNILVHVYIVKQLIDLKIAHFLGSPIVPVQSRPKCWGKSVKGIKIGDRKSPSIPPRFDHS